MAMMWDLLKEKSATKKDFRRPNIEAIPEDKFERLEIRDFDMKTGDSAVWHAEIPLRELFQNLPVESRIEPNWGMWRTTWGMAGFSMIFMFTYISLIAVVGPIHSVFPSVILALFGGSFFWWKGADWCPTPPFWVARRLWVNGVPHMQAIVHTGLQGEPKIDAMVEAEKLKELADKQSESENEDVIDIGGPDGRIGGIHVIGFEQIPEGIYVPVVPRSTTLYQDLQMAEERQEMRVPRDGMSKLAIGGMVLFAGMLIVGLIFVMAVTSNN